ncbi:MAG: signal recognition particle protein [SAR202 cluster bacterium]|jgi:signal recognition particle subunit SRP54|nr:signal recognition particle protein [SAR202 cluster bacterium]
MFESLSGKLTSVFQRLGNKGRLTAKDVDEALREIRLALLEADVNFKVVRGFVDRIRERALDEELLKSIGPGQQVVKITNEELTHILGGGHQALNSTEESPDVVLMVGLNGSGKTTTAAKLALHLKESGQNTNLVAADLHRPAAIEQLETLGKQIEIEVYRGAPEATTIEVADAGVKRARDLGTDWSIVDTAGRFQIDDDLMKELESVKKAISPSETILVVDAMTGQDAVKVAEEFQARIGLTGVILTKLDGDARGGSAISVVAVTGVPIKFIGTGERVQALEPFHPDRLASRILGMGDVLSLIEKTQESFDHRQAAELERKIRRSTFDLEDFVQQLQQLKKMGPLGQVLDMVPGFSSVKGRLGEGELGEDQIRKTEALIYSMTPEERRRPEIIGGSRRRRIAKGSGTAPQDVNTLLNQFRQVQKLMKQMSSGKGLDAFTRMLK